jgi:hypothetical protein
MTLSDRGLGWAGFDPTLVARSAAPAGARLAGARLPLLVLALLSLLSSAAIGASAAYACWLIGGGRLVAVGVGLALGAGTLNLLRVAAAGGGIAPQLTAEQATAWRPSWLPSLVLALLGLCFAQPALLALHAAQLEPQIAHYRSERLAAHAKLETDAERGAAAYRAALAQESFAVQRVLLVWRDRSAATRASLAFTLLCLLPLLAARWPFGRAVHGYELERYWRARTFVALEHAATERAVQQLLARWRGAAS